MTGLEHFDICVIGGGAGGLAVATGAALLGVPVALVEAGPPGADGAEDLATATLLAVTAQIETARRAPGLGGAALDIDLAAVRRHVAATVAAAAPAASAERLRALGITLIEGSARFLGPDRIAVAATATETTGTRTIRARRFVIATGGRMAMPAIPGLDQVPFLTTAGLAALNRLPDHLAIVGSGAEALEWAQAYRRLGSAVTVIDAGNLLGDEDPELVDLLLLRLRAEGVRLLAGTPVREIAQAAGTIVLTVGSAKTTETIEASHVLIAAGRRPAVAALGLDAAGVTASADGIVVDRSLRTTNRRIYALGEAVAPCHRAQDAAAQAGIVLRQILFRQRPQYDPATLPRVVQTDPALAHVGLTERQARATSKFVTILRCPLHDIDRARAERQAHGLVKVVAGKNGRILGVGIVGPRAEELIQVWQLSIAQRLKIGALANLATPYPTLGEASKRAAGSFFTPKLLSARTKKLVRWLTTFG
ncbi:MAG TPA: FAD-dependent oxidoreductase [Aliidongia sp.]|nr:FAD-dependent oxidoreductase [Aliidongia sp.]